MRRSENMCLNRKIKEGMKHNKRNVERLDSVGIKTMLDELKHEELSLVTFTSLADIYNVYYKFTIIIEVGELTRIKTISSEDDTMLWFEVDKLYKECTGKLLYSAALTYKELVDEFSKIGGKILFE